MELRALVNLILFVIITLLFVFSNRLRKKIEPPLEKKPQPEEPESEVKEVFKIFGFPLPEEPSEAKEPRKPEAEIVATPPVRREALEKPVLKKEPLVKEKGEGIVKKEETVLSGDKLQEGIILSAILGPPRARIFWRGGRTRRQPG